MDKGLWCGLQRFEVLLSQPTSSVMTGARWGPFPVSSSFLPCYELIVYQAAWRDLKAQILRQQNPSGCRDSVFAIGENGIGPSPCYKEVAALFSNSYSLGVDRVPFPVAIEEIRFTRRIVKWGTKLGTFDIRYKPRNSIKGQVLADFVAEFTPSSRASFMICQVTVRWWKVYMDEVCSARGSGVRVVLMSPKGVRVEKSLRLGFQASNDKAKYEALIVGLRAT